ncbi:MAG: nitroreductase family protein [Actinomycetota bacterium]
MDFYETVRLRRMVRNYDPRPVEDDKVDRIMAAARRGPSAGFSQGQSFVVVTQPETRQAIATIMREEFYVGQGFDPWVSRAPVHIVCCTSEELYVQRYSEPDKSAVPQKWPVPYWWVDAGASLMLILLAASAEGLAAGFLGTDAAGHGSLKTLLRIPSDVSTVGVVTIGYSAPDRRSGSLKRGYRNIEDVVHRGEWRLSATADR